MGARSGSAGPRGAAGGPPSDDNGSDSGSASNRWRRGYFGTGLVLTATVQTAAKLGLSALPSAPGALATVDGVNTTAALNTTYGSVSFGSDPDGARNFVLAYASTHVHSGTGLT